MFSETSTLSFLAGCLFLASANTATAATSPTANNLRSTTTERNLISRVEALEGLANEQRRLLQEQASMIDELTHDRRLQSSCTPAFDVEKEQCIFHTPVRFDNGLIASLGGNSGNKKKSGGGNSKNILDKALVVEGDFLVEGESYFEDNVKMEEDLLVEGDLEVEGVAKLEEIEEGRK